MDNKLKDISNKIKFKNAQVNVFEKYLEETHGEKPVRQWLKDNGYKVNLFGGKLNEHLNACGCMMAADGKVDVLDHADEMEKFFTGLMKEQDALEEEWENATGLPDIQAAVLAGMAKAGQTTEQIQQVKDAFTAAVAPDITATDAKRQAEDTILQIDLQKRLIDVTDTQLDSLNTQMAAAEAAKDDVKMAALIRQFETIDLASKTIEDTMKSLELKLEGLSKVAPSVSRKIDRLSRQQARSKKREEKRALKEQYKSGLITREQYKSGKKDIKDAKMDEINEHGGAFISRALKVFPATALMRNAYLLLLKINAWNQAHILDKVQSGSEANKPELVSAYKDMLNAWQKFGGDKGSLAAAINVGKDKPALYVSFRKRSNRKILQLDGDYSYFTDPASQAAEAAAASTPIWTTIGEIATAASAILGVTAKGIDALSMKEGREDAVTPPPTAPTTTPEASKPLTPNADGTFLGKDGKVYDIAGKEVKNQFDKPFYITYKIPLAITGLALISIGAYLLFNN